MHQDWAIFKIVRGAKICSNTFEKGVIWRKFFAAILLLGRRAMVVWTYERRDLFLIQYHHAWDVRCGRIHFIWNHSSVCMKSLHLANQTVIMIMDASLLLPSYIFTPCLILIHPFWSLWWRGCLVEPGMNKCSLPSPANPYVRHYSIELYDNNLFDTRHCPPPTQGCESVIQNC